MADYPRTFPVSGGFLAHRREMGSSIWEYLWLVAHVTSEDADGNGKSVGIVNHGNPVPTNRIATDLQRSREATLANLERLEAGSYIKRSASAGQAYEYRVYITLTELSG